MLNLLRVGVLIMATSTGFGAEAAEIKVITGGALKETMPLFEKEVGRINGSKLGVAFSPPGEVKSRILNGEKFDVVVIASGVVEDLTKQGKILANSKVNLFSFGTGVAVRSGTRKPDISTVDAFRRTLLNAKSIVYSDPATGAVSGVHFEKIINQLGIAKEIKAKSVLNHTPATLHNAEIVARGDAELGIQTTSEILAVKGADLVGPVPSELQESIVVSAGVLATSGNPKAAMELIKVMSSKNGAFIFKKAGMEPVTQF